MPVPHDSVFTGRMPFLPPNQQCQRTEGYMTADNDQRACVKEQHQFPQESVGISRNDDAGVILAD